nr:hypothetical protein LKV13_04820 [Borrelia sp. BU AG58]
MKKNEIIMFVLFAALAVSCGNDVSPKGLKDLVENRQSDKDETLTPEGKEKTDQEDLDVTAPADQKAPSVKQRPAVAGQQPAVVPRKTVESKTLTGVFDKVQEKMKEKEELKALEAIGPFGRVRAEAIRKEAARLKELEALGTFGKVKAAGIKKKASR